MKIFFTGATGVLGRRAVAQLLATGATPVEVSLFDRDVLSAAVDGHQVVCNLATAVPTGEQASGPDPWENNHRIRREGARNLVDAALHAGAERYIQESIALLYSDGGDTFLDESSRVEPTRITEPALTAESEAAPFNPHGGAGIALRIGTFYGFDSAHTIETIEAARQGLFTVPGPADAYWPSVTNDDAASAVVAALRAPGGLYDIAADRPLTRGRPRIRHAEHDGHERPLSRRPVHDVAFAARDQSAVQGADGAAATLPERLGGLAVRHRRARPTSRRHMAEADT